MTSNSAEILTILLAPFLGLPLPLLPIHILWINLVTDGLPGLALAIEPAERGVMRRPPRPPQESIFHGGMWQHMVWVGALMAGLALLSLAWDVGVDGSSWQTLVFTILVFAQLMHVLVIRSERDSLFTLGLWSNAPLAWVVLGSVLLQLAIVYTPLGNDWFRTRSALRRRAGHRIRRTHSDPGRRRDRKGTGAARPALWPAPVGPVTAPMTAHTCAMRVQCSFNVDLPKPASVRGNFHNSRRGAE